MWDSDGAVIHSPLFKLLYSYPHRVEHEKDLHHESQGNWHLPVKHRFRIGASITAVRPPLLLIHRGLDR